MKKFISLIKTHQQKIALSVGYALVALLAFSLGRYSYPKLPSPAPQVLLQSNYTPNSAAVQSAQTTNNSLNCQGKIKGSSSMIYHVPGGSFYDKTSHPIACFDTEAQAQAAGFRKSSR